MQIGRQFFLILVTFLVMVATANAQPVFTPNEKGEVSALTPEVRSLMEAADKVILDTTKDRQDVDKRVSEAAAALKNILANKNVDSGEILQAKMKYNDELFGQIQVRRPIRAATHKTAMMYFDNVKIILRGGKKLAPDDYGEWQDKTLAIQRANLPTEYKELNDQAAKAFDLAVEKDKESLRRFKLRGIEDEKKLLELQKEIDRLKK